MNEKKHGVDNLTLPYSTAIRPSKLSQPPGPNFMSEFSKFIAGSNSGTTAAPLEVKAEKRPTPKKSTPKKESTKTPRKKETIPKCTTSGLQIQVQDSSNNCSPETTNNVRPAVYEQTNNHNSNCLPNETYQSANVMMEQQMTYLPPMPSNQRPILNYNDQPMNMMPQSSQSYGVTVTNGMAAMPDPNIYSYNPDYIANNAMNHQPFNAPQMNYTDKNTQLVTHFNVSHTNVTKTPVVHDQMMTWRNGNIIMSE